MPRIYTMADFPDDRSALLRPETAEARIILTRADGATTAAEQFRLAGLHRDLTKPMMPSSTWQSQHFATTETLKPYPAFCRAQALALTAVVADARRGYTMSEHRQLSRFYTQVHGRARLLPQAQHSTRTRYGRTP